MASESAISAEYVVGGKRSPECRNTPTLITRRSSPNRDPNSPPGPPGLEGLPFPPVIARLAGLPSRVLMPFAGSNGETLLDRRAAVIDALGNARQALLESIESQLSAFDSATRRFLLAVKRDCFNARSIAKRQSKPQWTELLKVSDLDPPRILGLEEELRSLDGNLADWYTAQHLAERIHVLSIAKDSRFVRGMVFGHLGLVEKIRARAPHLAASDLASNPQKWEESLLRFATRAATKLSANSTLTAYALGSIRPPQDDKAIHFQEGPSHEVSLVRVDRPEAEQLLELLMRLPAVRSHGLVSWNESVKKVSSGQYQFIRCPRWEPSEGEATFQYAPPARVTARFPERLIDDVKTLLTQSSTRIPYCNLVARIEANLADSNEFKAQNLSAILEQLVEVGLVILTPPWTTHEDRLEQRATEMLDALLPRHPELAGVTRALREVRRLQESFAASSAPEQTTRKLRQAFRSLLQEVLPPNYQPPADSRLPHLFEDVLFLAKPSPGPPELIQLAPRTTKPLFRTLDAVTQFTALFNSRHDVLQTLAGWWKTETPSYRERPFLEVARSFSKVWKQYRPFLARANESACLTFNPLSLSTLDQLRDARKNLLAIADAHIASTPTQDSISPAALAVIAENIPQRYATLIGSSVFVQPTNPSCVRWVLNQIHEGTGRYLSRVTPILDGDAKRNFVNHLRSKSTVSIGGEVADLLEVVDPTGFLTNAHPVQAEKVLRLQGVELDLESERLVDLQDLRIEANLDQETFRLLDATGRRIVPVHLSSRRDASLSALLRFLLIFGPGETRGIFPFPFTKAHGDLRIFNRLTCGSLVLHRRRWDLPVDDLRDKIRNATALETHIAIHSWKAQFDLPNEGYFYERTYRGSVKPQYVDFTSPSLCKLFAKSIQSQKVSPIRFNEALPAPHDFPYDNLNQQRGLEFLIDSLATRAPSGNHSAEP